MHTEAWLQGFYDAYNFRPFKAGEYDLAEYRAGFESARRRVWVRK